MKSKIAALAILVLVTATLARHPLFQLGQEEATSKEVASVQTSKEMASAQTQEIPTPVQIGIMTVKQRAHSVLFNRYHQM